MRDNRIVRALFAMLVLLSPVMTAFGPPSLTDSDDVRMPIYGTELRLLNTLRPPAIPGTAAALIDVSTGHLMFQRNAHARVAPASITKMMTAVVAIERGNLDQKVVVLPDDMVEGSAMGVLPGDQVTMEQLLWGLLLPSGNDSAEVIARTLGGGSVDRFIDQMNQKAQQLNLVNTHYVNAHGLDADNHYSSAYDIAQLARYAMRMPLFAKIAGAKEYTVQANRTWVIHNTNTLLYLAQTVPGVTGVKTGFTDLAGDSLVASVNRDGRQVIAVVMGTNDRTSSSTALINFAYNYYKWIPVQSYLPFPATVGKSDAPTDMVMVPAWQVPYFRIGLELARTDESPWGAPPGFLVAFLAAQELSRLPLLGLRQGGS